jgi:hypothetical protein
MTVTFTVRSVRPRPFGEGGAVTDETPVDPPVHPKHRARDRFGKEALRTAHEITQALSEAGVDDDGVVVLRTGGPRPGLADLERLIDDALEEEARAGAEDAPGEGADDGAGGRAGDEAHEREAEAPGEPDSREP